jgi:hypothetical protein
VGVKHFTASIVRLRHLVPCLINGDVYEKHETGVCCHRLHQHQLWRIGARPSSDHWDGV